MAQITLPAEVVVKAAKDAVDDVDNKYPLPDGYEDKKERWQEFKGIYFCGSEGDVINAIAKFKGPLWVDECSEERQSYLKSEYQNYFDKKGFVSKVFAKSFDRYKKYHKHDSVGKTILNKFTNEYDDCFLVNHLGGEAIYSLFIYHYAELDNKLLVSKLTNMLDYTGEVSLDEEEYGLIKDHLDTKTNNS